MITDYYVSSTKEKAYSSFTFQLGIKELGLLYHFQQRVKGIIFPCFGDHFLPLGLTNLRTGDTEGLFMVFLCRFPLGLLRGLLLP